jgi:hypothetical protein
MFSVLEILLLHPLLECLHLERLAGQQQAVGHPRAVLDQASGARSAWASITRGAKFMKAGAAIGFHRDHLRDPEALARPVLSWLPILRLVCQQQASSTQTVPWAGVPRVGRRRPVRRP